MYVYICDVNVYIVIINITHNVENAQSCNLCVRVYVCAGFERNATYTSDREY